MSNIAFTVSVQLLTGRYEAGSWRTEREVEWPPHPARLFAAWRAVLEHSSDVELARNALMLIEQLPAPAIRCGAPLSHRQTDHYVIVNTLETKSNVQEYPARKSGKRVRSHVTLDAPLVEFHWEADTKLPSEFTDLGHFVSVIDELSSHVPYLGRSTSLVMMETRSGSLASETPLRLAPDPEDHARDVLLRIPYPGYLRYLEVLWQRDERTGSVPLPGHAFKRYRQLVTIPHGDDQNDHDIDWVIPSPDPEAIQPNGDDEHDYRRNPYPDLVVLKFEGDRPPGYLVDKFTRALRSTVMSRVEEPLPSVLHGHGDEARGNPHVAYLGLPHVGHEYATGNLFGLAVAIPHLEKAERRRIMRGILGSDPEKTITLSVPTREEPYRLTYQRRQPGPWALNSERWTQTSSTWVTSTPIVLDRYPKRGRFAEAVEQTVVHAGYPPPVSIEISKEPLTPGGIRLRPHQLPKRCQGRQYIHARITFAEEISGPVLVGAGRYFGVGLLAPERVGGRHAS